MSEQKMEKVLSGLDSLEKFTVNFEKAKKRAQEEGLKYLVSIKYGKAQLRNNLFRYELWIGDDLSTMNVYIKDIEYVYDIASKKDIGKKFFVERYIKKLSTKEKNEIIDRALVNFVLAELGD